MLIFCAISMLCHCHFFIYIFNNVISYVNNYTTSKICLRPWLLHLLFFFLAYCWAFEIFIRTFSGFHPLPCQENSGSHTQRLQSHTCRCRRAPGSAAWSAWHTETPPNRRSSRSCSSCCAARRQRDGRRPGSQRCTRCPLCWSQACQSVQTLRRQKVKLSVCSIPRSSTQSTSIWYDKLRHTFSSFALIFSATINMGYMELYLPYVFLNLLTYTSSLLTLVLCTSLGTLNSPR